MPTIPDRVWRLRDRLGFTASRAAILLATRLILAYVLVPIGNAFVLPASFALLAFGLGDPLARPGIWLNASWLEKLGLISTAGHP